MAEIKKIDEHTVIDYMARDYDSLLQSMRELIPSRLPEWKSYASEGDFGNVLLQLFAHMGDILSYYQDRVANESFLGTAQSRRSVIDHLQLIGYRLATASPASATLDLTIPAGCTAVITIRRGDAFATKSQKDKPSVRFEYSREENLVIDCATLAVDAATNKKYFKNVPVEEGRLVKNEILGISDGSKNQRFTLAHGGLILRAAGASQKINRDIIITASFGGVIDEWALRESLAFSREKQKDYTVEIDDGDVAAIVFGDGTFGAIPAGGATIRATYRVGGGLKGNTPPNTIQTIVDASQLVLNGIKATNSQAATGGAERESIKHAVMHAPAVFRSLKRAVTEDDYKALALDFKGVGKVRAGSTSWNRVTLFVAPEGGGRVSDVLEGGLLAYFEDKRPVTTIITIEDVEYVKLYLTAAIGVKSYYPPDDVKEKVMTAAAGLLAFDNVDFGQTIYLSKFYEAIEAVEGVEYVTISEFRRQNQPPGFVEPAGKIAIKENEIPVIPVSEPAYTQGIKVVIEGES
ncbi:MAG: baseplate J/gp47 family protein [Deltaproteobacteria bacterium]|nr:baseplate J/gp47 family protein [Deltaproteobacteria bacterium]